MYAWLFGACFFGVSTRKEPCMYLTINRMDRDTLYDGLMTDLTAIGDIFGHLHNDEPIHAKRLRRRFEVELRLLDDLGWEKEPEAVRFELTMPAGELRPIVERVYWSAVSATPTVCAQTSSMELAGLEPATSWVRSRRSPN
jgi:hypothetical protein